MGLYNHQIKKKGQVILLFIGLVLYHKYDYVQIL